MDLTYTWTINSFRKRNEPYLGPRDTGLVDVISSANWTVTGTHANGSFSEFRNTSPFWPDDNNFIPYQDLTEEIVLNWIKADLTDFDYEMINEAIALDIDQSTATVTVKPDNFPWNN
tara:strand:+ start:43 stop:393 length:351 start_codon:yes stop_codon:yes gene_type:complete